MVKKVFENNLFSGVGEFSRNLPFYGTQGDYNFTVGRSRFTPGVAVKQVPFSDMSIQGDPGFSDFDIFLNNVKNNYRVGSRARGIKINSQFESDSGKTVVGKIHKVVPNYEDRSVRVWLKDPKTLKITEVYSESIERVYESYLALSFSQFINS
jgi:hypothetical protein